MRRIVVGALILGLLLGVRIPMAWSGHMEANCSTYWTGLLHNHIGSSQQNHCVGGFHNVAAGEFEYFDVQANWDNVEGKDGRDEIHLGGGNDYSNFGENGNDKLWGGEGEEALYGGYHDDILYDRTNDLGIDHDKVCAGPGTDDAYIDDGDESDSFYGGDGADMAPAKDPGDLSYEDGYNLGACSS